MPGLSSPGGPSHQALEDIALMRALPNMAVLDLSDASEIEQAVALAANRPGPVYLRLKRGEIPKIFSSDHRLEFGRTHLLRQGRDVTIIASGMMVPAALVAADVLEKNRVSVTVVNSPSIKPFDSETVVAAVRGKKVAISVENHSVIGGLGSAVAEAMTDAGVGVPLRRIGIQDVFGESGSREFLFEKYGLDVSAILRTAWASLGRTEAVPQAPVVESKPGLYSPV
jgi:transketolase